MSEKWEEEAEKMAARGYQSRLARAAEYAALCESPIERLFAVGLAGVSFDTPIVMSKAVKNVDLKRPYYAGGRTDFIMVWPQQQIGPYRVDFAVRVHDDATGQNHWFVVECDGHEFHERTKEQAAADRSRDRALMLAGYKVVRFTGSELHNRLDECMGQFFDLVLAAAYGNSVKVA